jgi:hypothetical protein
VSESSNSWPVDDGDWPDFDVQKFARNTIFAIESGDDDDHIDQLRLIRLEEIVAARWPRSLFLRWRLAREIRASVATWDDRYIPRGDFAGRRMEWAGQQGHALRADRRRRQAERQAEDDARTAQEQPPAEGGADPGEGFLP